MCHSHGRRTQTGRACVDWPGWGGHGGGTMVAQSADLAQRLKAEFDARTERQKAAQRAREQQDQEHEARLEQFQRDCEEMRGIWVPRLEEFAKQFGGRVKVTPTITRQSREAKAVFDTDMAMVTLTLTASADLGSNKLVLDYDLF